ncbi:ammonia monooxygenase [Falsochrobactrum shanghaiense]|uniref:Ammonia monooxygenase n=1 Tax=Falsochrobactrum shanghaiense TaxID=2201899 RepID=A0A316J7K9_9HYPH|nr:AbrB family transcriptional regulator [Falsochrobactrum shanghaiense]PWL17138.1 ammonia monooxygenase [Falsochrobactrum shanghaiense]
MQKRVPPEPKTTFSSVTFTHLAKPVQWSLLLALSLFLVYLGEMAGLPAAILLGAMLAAILMASRESSIRVHRHLTLLAQAIIGLLIARAMTVEFFASMGQHLPVIFLSTGFTLLASTMIGYFLARFRIVSGTTAVWGISPGAAAAMTLMADSFGADARLVAFMQYLRVVLVVTVASLVVMYATGTQTAAPAAIEWFPPINWPALLPTLAVIICGAFLGDLSRIPTGAMLIPLALGAFLQDMELMVLDLPPWLLAVSYILIGWRIGLGFSRAILAHAARAFPAVLASTLLLIAICGLFGVFLGYLLDLDPLTAYLATSPGGADTVAIIAASSDVDLPFVIALQTSRFFIVLLAGPAIARFIASRIQKQIK